MCVGLGLGTIEIVVNNNLGEWNETRVGARTESENNNILEVRIRFCRALYSVVSKRRRFRSGIKLSLSRSLPVCPIPRRSCALL